MKNNLTIVGLVLTLVFSFIDCYSFTSSPSSSASSVSKESVEEAPKPSI